MSDPTALSQAEAAIEKAWGQPIAELQERADRFAPLLQTALRIHSSLVISNNALTVHQDRLHALTRPGQWPAVFYNLQRITDSASALRTAHAECHSALQAVHQVIDARQIAREAEPGPSDRRVQAAVARSAAAASPFGQLPAAAATSAAIRPLPASSGPRR